MMKVERPWRKKKRVRKCKSVGKGGEREREGQRGVGGGEGGRVERRVERKRKRERGENGVIEREEEEEGELT